jgi:hypothetical protein
MAAGYGLGALMLLEPGQRRRQLLGLGLGLIVLFVTLRFTNRYGNPLKWTSQDSTLFTLFSFINCTKYPPSLLFLLMTLGPALVLLALFDRQLVGVARPLIVFGRVPLFYYLLHIPLIHGLAVALDHYRFGWSPLAHASFWALGDAALPDNYGFSLPMVYAIWIGVVVALYPLCWWYARIKQRHRDGWLSYF